MRSYMFLASLSFASCRTAMPELLRPKKLDMGCLDENAEEKPEDKARREANVAHAGTAVTVSVAVRKTDGSLVFGAGTIIGKDLIATAKDLVKDAAAIDVAVRVLDDDGKTAQQARSDAATLIKSRGRLALLKVMPHVIPHSFDPLVIREDWLPIEGETVWRFGLRSPAVAARVVNTMAPVSDDDKAIEVEGATDFRDLGSPILNHCGEIAGILVVIDQKADRSYYLAASDMMKTLKIKPDSK